MTIEYLVLEAYPDKGPFEMVCANKMNKSWPLQEALDELGQQGWEICTTIYGPTRDRGNNGDLFCQGLILKRTT